MDLTFGEDGSHIKSRDISMSLERLSERTGHLRQAVLKAIVELEDRGLIQVERVRRGGNTYRLIFQTDETVSLSSPHSVDPGGVKTTPMAAASSVKNTLIESVISVKNTSFAADYCPKGVKNTPQDPAAGMKNILIGGAAGVKSTPIAADHCSSSVKITPQPPGPSVKSTLIRPLDGMKNTLIDAHIEGRKQQLAAAAISLSSEDRLEVRRLSELAAVQIDGQEALKLKAGVEAAQLSLAHLRRFLRHERFSGARDRKAVLPAIARDFRIRSDGIEWPESLEPEAPFEGNHSLRRISYVYEFECRPTC